MTDPVPHQGESDGARLSAPLSTDAPSDRRSESLTASSPASAAAQLATLKPAGESPVEPEERGPATAVSTLADAAVYAVVFATMPDGSPISSTVKVDAILDLVGVGSAPDALRRLLASGIVQRLRFHRRRHKHRVTEAA